MYKQILTDASFITATGSTVFPVATLEDESGQKLQIAIDDHCYVMYLSDVKDKRYVLNSWIFKEAFEVLKTLPSPE